MSYYFPTRFYMMPDMFPPHTGQYNHFQISSARRKNRRAKIKRRLR